MSQQHHEAPRTPGELAQGTSDNVFGSPEAIAMLEAVTGCTVEELYHFEGYGSEIIRHFPETIIHDVRWELPCVLDHEGVVVTPEVVGKAAELISEEPMILVDYPLPEIFTRVRRMVEEEAAVRPPRTTGASVWPPQVPEGSSSGKRSGDRPAPPPDEGPGPTWEALLRRFLEDQPQGPWQAPGNRPLAPATEPAESFSAAAMAAFARWVAQRGYTACGQCQAPWRVGIAQEGQCPPCDQRMMEEMRAEMARDPE
jgi:hypothetical protein